MLNKKITIDESYFNTDSQGLTKKEQQLLEKVLAVDAKAVGIRTQKQRETKIKTSTWEKIKRLSKRKSW